jgi:hypothetical protein
VWVWVWADEFEYYLIMDPIMDLIMEHCRRDCWYNTRTIAQTRQVYQQLVALAVAVVEAVENRYPAVPLFDTGFAQVPIPDLSQELLLLYIWKTFLLYNIIYYYYIIILLYYY